METFTPFDIIKLTENASYYLYKITEDIIEIESHFNSVVSDLNNTKETIDQNSKKALSDIDIEYKKQVSEKESHFNTAVSDLNDNEETINFKKQISEKEDGLKNGLYVPEVLISYIQTLDGKKTWNILLQVLSVIVGSIVLATVNWLLGLVLGGIGFWIFLSSNNTLEEIIVEIQSNYNKKSFSEQDITNLGKLSDELFDALNDEKKIINSSINSLRKRLDNEITVLNDEKKIVNSNKDSQRKILENEFSNMLIKEAEERSKKLNDHEYNRQMVMSDLRSKTDLKIQTIERDLNYLVKLLNQIPESFDSNLLDWDSDNIIKGKESVATNFRLGVDKIKINIEGIQHIFDVPRCIPFLNKSNLVFYCNGSIETKEAIRITHNIIGRTLLALPASKTKITFIDPLELGGNAAPFTPLLREIYGGMVFTQQNDIENQLSILTRAIENVIQRYLQDKFADIADYNFKTKEVPEPYRLLVVYNFPHGFNDTIAKKLLNIIKSGPKAGVHTILVTDKTAKLPYGIEWNAFEGININNISLIKSNTTNRQFEFDKDLPYSEIVDYINKELPNTNSIKVPFTKYIGPQSEWWQEKAHKSFSVPIGRHALEVQNLKFDNDDDNQALLIGKPGSGKSNLLHVIIANSIWKYSPDQLEIYLIDFKGGVEFTIYADKKIPHIKTIAIESEREFGLSVLEGVEKELLRRENEFSKSGVQNIEQYHVKYPEIKMPRVLLIVDEFQEFYSEDDNIKQAVDDKFDRIVRKGRAFGINTLFSSQTLSGNSIKKSTKELIDIRIALMCSDLDSNQILDDRNPAARDLTRPGEGIYNSENGKVEGNRKFQAFYIETADLKKTIESVVAFANTKDNSYTNFKQIVFRGSEKAIMEKDTHPLKKVNATSAPKSLRLWVGEPVAIADDVTAVLRKQGGSNLLVAGYDENIGVRVMSSSIISIAAQQLPYSCKFYSFNFYNVDSELLAIPDQLFSNIQQECKSINNKQVKESLESIKEEIENRLSEKTSTNTNIYLAFFSLQRGRAFRKDGYSMSDEGNLLAFILKEGPDVGIYSLVQVDTMDNFSKNLDDNLLKEFSQRIASQMNPDNSVKLIGNQKAAKLGSNRAWCYDDNENTMIKFKPYELPTNSWVAQLQSKSSILS